MTTASLAATDSQELNTVVKAQLTSLDDTDCYASAWSDALQSAAESSSLAAVSWGGRGRGGRGLARRTLQPYDVIVENVRLEYVSTPGLPGKVLLEGATLKLLSPRVYSLVGRNGCGKSTLLRRIQAGKIPGLSPHISTVYVPQEVIPQASMTPIEMVFRQSSEANQSRLEQLEEELENLDIDVDENTEMVEELCQKISELQDEMEGGHDAEEVRKQAEHALSFFGVDESLWNVPSSQLSAGLRKKVILASALFCQSDLLLLDEPTNYLDVKGLVQLRRLISECTKRNTTVLMVSHDVDLINDMATDVIHFFGQSLSYYPGNYRDFVGYKSQRDLCRLRQHNALEKQREGMLQTIENMKKQPAGKRGGAKKKARGIESRKKKLEKHGLEKDDEGHRFSVQKAGTGVRQGSINSMDASTRHKLTHSQLLKRAEASVAPVPDKAVQFVFRNTTCTWGEPLVMLMDVGDGYGKVTESSAEKVSATNGRIVKKDGMLFDCVDLCIDEGSTTCILGANGSGKTTLLHILAKRRQPREGRVHYGHNVSIGYFDDQKVDEMIETCRGEEMTTALSLLAESFPSMSEQDLRSELTNFGLNPQQASTNVKFLSGGERCRLCLASLMLRNPQVLILDEPTSHMDIESVEALAYGLKQWNGTVVMVSHDANLIRALGGNCYVIMEDEGKLRRIPDGIDSYLKTFSLT